MAYDLDLKAPDAPAHECEACGGTLTHLGDMPRTLTRAAYRVFRCYRCNAVFSERLSAIDQSAHHHWVTATW
jgi:hypothetical protein